jgi:glycosyltransferase involved in cell wall biosynthesis
VVSDALYPWHTGGKEMRYRHLLNHLPEHDMDVTVYSMKWWEVTPAPIHTSRGSLTYRALCPRVAMYKGRRRSIFQAVLFAAATLRLLNQQFDVIEADHMPYLQLIPLRLVAWVKRAPLVITWHEVWGKDTWRKYLGHLGTVAALVEQGCIRLPNAIVAASSGTAEKLKELGARRVEVAPNTLEFDDLSNITADPAAPNLLFVGRLIEHKHANLAIEATGILAERGLDVRLGIIGVGPEESRLRSQVSDAHLGERVDFFMSLDSQSAVWSLIRGAKVVLAPSVREGFGMVVAEALALGTPVICADHPDNESSSLISSDTGSLIPPFDAVALADAAEYWLNDTSRRDERRHAFISKHQDLTVEALVETYVRVLRSVT